MFAKRKQKKAEAAELKARTCPECGQVCKSRGGLGSHMHHKHRPAAER